MKSSNNRPTLRESLLQSALLLAMLAVLFPGTFFLGRVISSADILFALPHWDKYAPQGWDFPQNKLVFDHIFFTRPNFLLCQQEVRNGEWPLWNHLQLTGIPLLANFQSSVFYPVHLLQLVLQIDWALTVYVILKLFLCGMVGYVCARLLAFSTALARFFSVAWMLGSYNLLWCHWPLTDVAIWVPPLFAGLEFVLREQYRRGFFTVAFSGTLLLLAGHPETAFTFCLGLGGYFVVRLFQQRRMGLRLIIPIGVCVLAWLLVFLACASQLVPFFEYLVHSTSEFARNEAEGGEIYMPGMVAAFWAPRFFGTWAEDNFLAGANSNSNLISMLYPGMAVWLGTMFMFTRSNRGEKDRERRNMAIALAIPAAFGLLLSFYFPTLQFVHRLPLMNTLREWYHACFAMFAFPLLATLGFERWFSRPRRLRETAWALPPLIAGALVIAVLLRFDKQVLVMKDMWGYVVRESWLAAGLASAGLVLCGISCFVRRPRVLLICLTLFAAGDYALATRGLRPSLPREQVFPETALLKRLQSIEPPRRFGVAEGYIPPGTVANYGIEEWLGYDGLYPERIRRFQLEMGTGIWNAMEPVCSIGYYLNYPQLEPVLKLDERPYLRYVDTVDGMEIYENTRAFGRAYLVPQLEVIPDIDALFETMRDPEFNPSNAVVTEKGPPVVLTPPKDGVLGTANVTLRQPTRVVVEVEAMNPCVLVLSDAYYPGWNARIDGEPAEIFPAYYAFRGLLVPSGRHTVEYSYFPLSLRIGLLTSTGALLAGAYSAFRVIQGTRRRNRGARAG
ncbi:MAG TPA: YfhO family protein [Candidatus Hydrogenedentes bacterium]|nr:YfhO family protein [Candidatus Hydrogenedentota bacterium]